VSEHVVTISPRTTAFTVVCAACAVGPEGGWTGATFAGQLDLDLRSGVFLCRGGHRVRVERADPATPSAPAEAA
jgi:hypothetical protein